MNNLAATADRRIRVLVADHSRIHTQLWSDALERDPSLEVIAWDGNRSTLIPITVDQNVDVVAIGSNLEGSLTRSLQFVRDLRDASPATRVVVLLDSQNKEGVIDAFRAGAKGIFSCEGSIEMFRKCMQRVYQGEIWADTSKVSLAIEALASAPLLRTVGKSGVNLLSKRELEVVECLVQGMTNREIAKHIGLSQHTVKNYLFRVFDKLGVSSRTELLFMTFNQENRSGESVAYQVSRKMFEGDADDEGLAFLEKAASERLPSAQMALAQVYFKRNSRPDDLVKAYMWYLIATEGSAQLSATLTSVLTPKQIHEAQQKASLLFSPKKPKSVSVMRHLVPRSPSERADEEKSER